MTAEARIRDGIARYRAWQRHHDAALAERVLAVQAAQTARLRQTHADLLADPITAPLTCFFLNEIYTGLDLEELAREIERALPIAVRLLPDSVMRTAAIAAEANALTGELDEAVAQWLLDHDADAADEHALAEALRQSRLPERHHQAELLRELGLGLDRYVRSRMILGTFRLVARPARAAGFRGLYDFMDHGFTVMKPMRSVADFLDTFLGRELNILDNLATLRPQPFRLDSIT